MAKTNDDEERLSALHFNLSSTDRRRIMEELLTQSLKLNEVAKKLDITATEAFRQLQRLTDAGFLEKTVDGKYRSTNYCGLILESSAASDFLSKHREYFASHDTSLIPPHFRARFGELSGAIFHPDPVTNINTATAVLEEAQGHIDVMSEQSLLQHKEILRRRSREGVKIRFMFSQDRVPQRKEEELLDISQFGEVRFLPKICGVIIITDRSAGMALPRLDGKVDYQVLAGIDEQTIGWMADLYADQWNKAKPWHP